MINQPQTTQTILLIEDSDEDFFATDRAFKKSGYNFLDLKRVSDAKQALDFLSGRGEFKNLKLTQNLPSLILLDLNLPGVDGRDLLVQLKTDDRFKQIPIIVLTTSNNPRDISYCFQNGANSYQVKTIGFQKFLGTIQTMIKYWFETAQVPATNN